MALGFEISLEDVAMSIKELYNIEIDQDDEQVKIVYDHLNMDEIENQALYGNSIEQQLDYAINEIQNQLKSISPTDFIIENFK